MFSISIRPWLTPPGRGVRVLVALVLVAGCAVARPIPGPAPAGTHGRLLYPGDPRIAHRRPTGAACYLFTSSGPGDSAARAFGTLAVEWGLPGQERDDLAWLRSAFGGQTEDTLVYDGGSLAPRRERLRVADQQITLRYHGATVERMVQRGDSVEPFHATTFAHPMFGFNQRDLLLGVVRLQPGDTIILPLYSEIDGALELDTISLVQPEAAGDPRPEVTIRFADPAIVAVVTVDTLTGGVVRESIQNRKRPGRSLRRAIMEPEHQTAPAGPPRCAER